MRTTERLNHTQRAQQIRYAVRSHRRAAVTVNRQLIEHDVLPFGCFGDKFLRQHGTLAVRVAREFLCFDRGCGTWCGRCKGIYLHLKVWRKLDVVTCRQIVGC